MPNGIKIYECHCGQLTPIDTGERAAVCSRCGDHKFSQVHWFEPNRERGATSWMHSTLAAPPQNTMESTLRFNGHGCVTRERVEDNEDSKLDLGRARAVLTYFEMLKRVDAISYADYDVETQRVLRRVIHVMREQHSRGD